MRRRSFISIPAVAAVIPTSLPGALPEDTLIKAMRDELKRSLKKLQLENLEKPYFLSYRISETQTVSAAASFGALSASNEFRRRVLATECRVGSYEMDNTNFYSARNAMSGVIRVQASFGITLPLDDDYDEIRRQLWLSTDAGYKQALDDLAKKRAALENRTRTGAAIADLSKEERTETVEDQPATLLTKQKSEALAKQLSALFRDAKGIDNSGVRIESTNILTRFVSSEGTEFWRNSPSIMINWYAEAQASDGMPISDVETHYFNSASEIPDLTLKIRAFQKRLLDLTAAKTLTRYAGPVLFEGQAAAELFAQGFATALLGTPRIVVDDQRFEGIFGANTGVFSDKISTRVLPSHMRLTDDPTRPNLAGSYKVDEDGVKTKPTVVVQGGILKRLLNTRALVPGVSDSTANRRAAGIAPSNLILESSKAVPAAQLKQDLLQIVKDRGLEFGVMIRKIANPADQFAKPRGRMVIFTGGPAGQALQLSPVIEAVKVFPDGREELLRNIEISGFNTAAFRDLSGVSQETTTYTAQFRNPRMSPLMGGMIMQGRVLTTYIVPSLLFEDVTLQLPAGEVPKLPFIAHPSFA
jgi:hypothetical protein